LQWLNQSTEEIIETQFFYIFIFFIVIAQKEMDKIFTENTYFFLMY